MVVGYDMRFRSEDFARAVAEVLAGNGIPVYLAEHAAPTPVLSYTILPRKAAGGIWITASHNPPTDNGFKLRSSYAGAAAPETLDGWSRSASTPPRPASACQRWTMTGRQTGPDPDHRSRRRPTWSRSPAWST